MIFEILRMAFESLLSNKVRTALSMLGIVIGVSTVIAVFAVGQGAQNAVNEQFQGLSANSIIIMSQRGRGTTGSSNLKASDAEVIAEKATYVADITAIVRGNGDASFGSESASLSLTGVQDNYFRMSSLELEKGRLISAEDVTNKEKYAVLGSGAVESLFVNGEDPIGQFIKISGKQIEVIGVIKETGRNMGPMSMDDAIYLPYTTAEKSVLGGNASVMINATANDVANVEAATTEIEEILRAEHKLKITQENDFNTMDAGSMVESAQESAKLMTVLLTAIAAITLLVSGIGIMNVMFVTVAERTKEIGIARAIGGKQMDILSQFLLESVILSMLGGIIGIGIGLGAIPLMSKFNLVAVAFSWTGPLIGFTFSVVVGVFFGFYPAFKASRLDPVDALRSE